MENLCSFETHTWHSWYWHCVWSNSGGSYFSYTRCTSVIWQVCGMSPPSCPPPPTCLQPICRPLHGSLVLPHLHSCLTSTSHKFNNFGRSISKSLSLRLGLDWRVSGYTRHPHAPLKRGGGGLNRYRASSEYQNPVCKKVMYKHSNNSSYFNIVHLRRMDEYILL